MEVACSADTAKGENASLVSEGSIIIRAVMIPGQEATSERTNKPTIPGMRSCRYRCELAPREVAAALIKVFQVAYALRIGNSVRCQALGLP